MLQHPLQAWRRLRRSPAATVTALATISLAFAANVAIFSVVDGVLLRALPFDQPAALVRVLSHPEANPEITFEISYPEFEEVHRGVRGARVAGTVSLAGGLTVRLHDELASLPGAVATADLFELLGVLPILGRPWRAEDDVAGAEPVVALGERLWRREFAADPGVLGRTLEIGGQHHRVSGVLPAAFEYPVGAELWIPVRSYLPASLLENASIRFLNPVARLRPGVTPAAAVAEWNALIDRTVDARLPESARSRVSALVLADDLLGASRRALLFLWAAAALVLLIACANVTNLQTVRALASRREHALRRALGARFTDLARLASWESALVALGGALLGTALGAGAVRWLLRASPVELYRGGAVSLDPRVCAFAAALAAVVALLVGVLPLLAVRSPHLGPALKEGGARTAGPGTAGGLLRALVVAQAALAVVLTLGAALLLHSFVRLRAEDPGFDRDRVLGFELVQVDGGPSFDTATHDLVVETLVDEIGRLPEVAAAGAVLLRPLQGLGGFDAGWTIAGRPPEESAGYPQINYQAATPGYFATIGAPLLAGRTFTTADDEHAAPVALISRAVARRFFPDTNPLGQRFKFGGADAPDHWIEIAGVIGDARYRSLAEVSLDVFVPFRQTTWPLYHLAVRSRHDRPGALSSEVRAAVRGAALGVEAVDVTTFDAVLERSLARPRFQTVLLGIFAALALLLGAVGLYGVMSYLLSVRRQELAVRVAVGAAPADLVRQALGEAATLALAGTAAGAAIGLVLAQLGARRLPGVLHGVGAADPLALTAAVVVFLVAALLAGLPPALRASRVDPIDALRGK